MSFAKMAAEALVNEDAEAEREEKRNRWKKWLSTIAGLGALGTAGYLGYKYWPEAPKNVFQKWTGDTAASLGALGGAIGGEVKLLGQKMPWHHSAGGENLTGIRDSSAKGGEAPLDKYIAGLNASMPGKDKGQTIHSELNEAMSPNAGAAHPLAQARNFETGASKPLIGGGEPNLLNKFLDYYRSRNDSTSLIKNLRTIHGTPSPTPAAPAAPGEPGMPELPPLAALPPPPKAGGPAFPPGGPQPGTDRALLAQQIREGLQKRTGLSATQWADHLDQARRMKSTTLGPVARPILHGLIGAGVGAGADWAADQVGLGPE